MTRQPHLKSNQSYLQNITSKLEKIDCSGIDVDIFLSKYPFRAVEHLFKAEHCMFVTVIHGMMFHNPLEECVPSLEGIDGHILYQQRRYFVFWMSMRYLGNVQQIDSIHKPADGAFVQGFEIDIFDNEDSVCLHQFACFAQSLS